MVFQLGSALLDVCVLAILARQDSYGYSLTSELKNVMSISESTLYPVLRRLQKEGLLTTYDQPHQGRNRRYYRITPAGNERLWEYREQWHGFKAQLDRILEEGSR